MDNHTLLLIFVIFTGISVFLQAGVLLGILISVRKAAQSVRTVTDDLKATVIPVIHSSREILEKISPQIVTVSQGLADLTEAVHRQSKGVSISATEIMDRVNRQTMRLDAMLTVGLNAVEKAGATLESTVAKPMRQANGIAAAFKAAIDTYIHTPSRRRPLRPALHIEPLSEPVSGPYSDDPGI
jgi:methyl-accepting chemotaxis protein